MDSVYCQLSAEQRLFARVLPAFLKLAQALEGPKLKSGTLH